MGRIKPVWQLDFTDTLNKLNISFQKEASGDNDLVLLNNGRVVVHLVSLEKHDDPASLITLQEDYQQKNSYLVHLWEDIWYKKREQVLGRINSILGHNKKLHGRKAKIISIHKKAADDFLYQNHLQSSVKAKYKFALSIDEQIVAVALFSAGRPMKNIGPNYKSYEVVRFASLLGVTVTGGFTKLLKHFIGLVQPDDLMSYADRDWSLGNAYEQSGFKLISETPPMEMWLDKRDGERYFPHRLPADIDTADLEPPNFLPVFNTGNLKYILYL